MNELLAVPLISKNGIRGKVLTTSRLLDDSPEKPVVFENGRRVSVPSEHLHLRPDGSYYLDLTVDPRDPRPAETAVPPDQNLPAPSRDVVMPVIQEQAQVTKRTVETGRVRVRKTVSEEPTTIDEPIIHSEYEVRRVPINQVVETKSPTRVDGDATIIPIYEEETVTITRLVLREEVHLIRRQRTEHNPRTITLRKEHVEIERIPAKT